MYLSPHIPFQVIYYALWLVFILTLIQRIFSEATYTVRHKKRPEKPEELCFFERKENQILHTNIYSLFCPHGAVSHSRSAPPPQEEIKI